MEDEVETDDLPGPPPVKPRLVRELERGLGRGQEFYDETGRRLVTVDEILEQLRRTGKVYGPK